MTGATSSDYQAITLKLREETKKLLDLKDVKYIIGWKYGSYGLRISPAFVESENEIESLVYSPFCINNLSVYPTLEEKLPLPRGVAEDTRKIGVMVKGCDSRGLVQLFAENGYPRDRLIIMGVPCTGQIDHDKLLPILIEKGADKNIRPENITVTDSDDQYKIEINEQNIELQVLKVDVLYNKCITCIYPNPIIHDIMLAEEVEPRGKISESYERVDELSALEPNARWNYWAEKFDRCIRCYACRNICPVCYCRECLADKWEPDWVNKSVNLTENTMFHIMRAMHVAGRCIDCHECQRACPVGIPLLDIYKKLEKDVLNEFNFIPGTDPELKPLLSTFKPDDPGEFIL